MVGLTPRDVEDIWKVGRHNYVCKVRANFLSQSRTILTTSIENTINLCFQ